ncbi:MAG: AraC family transcriptional regulator, partial [Cyclobacteriaceae bacterium]|nr:AraC family transcriptional regulator [Cyclobacteriaceae bacterium]
MLPLEIKNSIYLLSVFLGIFSGVIVLWYGYKKYRPNVLFGFSHLVLTYAVFIVYLIDSGNFSLFPDLYRTGNIAGLLFAPLTFLYVRLIIKGRPFRVVDLLHFLPAVVYIIDFFPIFFQISSQEKLALIQSEIDNPAVFVYYNQSRFFPANFYTIMRTFQVVFYWAFSTFLIYKFARKFEESKESFGKEWVRWMRFFMVAWMLLFLPYIILNQFGSPQLGFDLLHFTGSLTVLINSMVIFFFPKVLYGLDEFNYKVQTVTTKEIEESSPLLLDKEKLSEIKEKLEKTMEKDKVFLENGLTISELSKRSDIPSYLLTLYLNR